MEILNKGRRYRHSKARLREIRNTERSEEAIAERYRERARLQTVISENNARIVDGQSKHNQASGKMKRAGVIATKLRSA